MTDKPNVRNWSWLFILLFFDASLAWAGAGITYHGRILQPNGNPVSASSVQFRLQIRSPGSENCLLYEELQTKNLSQSNGIFALTLNDGSGTRTDPAAYSLDRLFQNRGTMTTTGLCTIGNTYAPNPGDGRKIAVEFNDGSGWEPMPALLLNYVPLSIESMSVGGYKAENILRVENAGVPQSVTPLTSAQLAALVSVADTGNVTGNAATATTATNATNATTAVNFSGSLAGDVTGTQGATVVARLQGRDVSTTAPANGEVLKWNGTAWAPAVDGGGGGSVTSVGAVAPLSSTGGATPDISLAAGTVAGQTLRWGGASWSAAKLNYQDLVNNVAASPWPGASCSSGQFLTWSSVSDNFACTAVSGAMINTALGYTPLSPANNLSDVANAATARTNLGVVAKAGDTMTGALNLPANGLSVGTDQLIATSNSVGIGTATPSARLQIRQTDTTDTTGDVVTLRSDLEINPVANQAVGARRFALHAESRIPVGSTTESKSIYGAAGSAENYGTNIVEKVIGSDGWAYNVNNATVDRVMGGNFGSEVDAGTVDNLFGIGSWSGAYGGTINNMYGHRILQDITAGTVTNRYGLYMASSGSATNDFGIYQASSNQTNYFSGRVGIGTTTPRELFSVGTGHSLHSGGDPQYYFNAYYDTVDARSEFNGHSAGGFAGNLAFDDESGALNLRTSTTGGNLGDPITWNSGLYLLANGNVGIGTSNPQSLLHINGVIRATDICDENGANCRDISTGWGGGGTVTSVTSANADIGVATTTSTPVLTLNSGTGANQILKLNASSEIPAVSGVNLTALNASNLGSGTVPAARMPALTGDATMTAGTTATTVARIQGRNVAATAPLDGQVYRWNNGGTQWEPVYFGVDDLRTSAGASQFSASCTASQTLTWSAVTDAFTCANIAGLNASVLTAGTIDNARLPASATYWSAATGGINYAGGKVGIGTATPSTDLHVNGSFAGKYGMILDEGAGVYPQLEIQASSPNSEAGLLFLRTRGTIGSPTAVSDGDVISSLIGRVHNGTQFENAAYMQIAVDGTNVTGSGNHPGGMFRFSTRGPSHTGAYGAGLDAMTIRNNGNVGIGNNNPSAKLDVAGDLEVDDEFYITSLNGASNRFQSVNIDPYVWDATAGSEGTGVEFFVKEGGAWLSPLAISANIWQYRNMRYDVANTVNMWNRIQSNGGAADRWPRYIASNFLDTAADGYPAVVLWTSGGTSTTPAITPANKYVGVVGFWANKGTGTIDDIQVASILGKTSSTFNGSTDVGGDLIFQTRNAAGSQLERMRMTAEGNVGIGTTSPNTKLTVVGGITSTESVTGTALTASSGGAAVYPQSQVNAVSTSGHGQLVMFRARGTDLATPQAVSDTDTAGSFIARVHNGTQYEDAAQIRLAVDGTNVTGSGNHPGGQIEFKTRDVADTGQYSLSKVAMVIRNSGNVGIGITAPSHILHINGQGRATNSAWATTSDARLKDIQGDFQYGLNEILSLNTVWFNYKKDNPLGLPSQKTHAGVIAQELQKVIPEAVEKTDDGYLTVNSDPVHWAVINSIKELWAKIVEGLKKDDEHDRRLAQLETENSQLKKEVQDLKSQNSQIKSWICRQEPSSDLCR